MIRSSGDRVVTRPIRVGTRGSRLALVQADLVIALLRQRFPDLAIATVKIETAGDRDRSSPLPKFADQGVFVSALEDALFEDRIDVAVHSAKDVPTRIANGLTLASFPARADARDALVSRFGSLGELPRGARIGTCSVLRANVIRSLRPDLEVRDVRGNVDTRLARLARGEYDALVLAMAGLERLGAVDEHVHPLSLDDVLPAAGQGALALEVRTEDAETLAIMSALDDADVSSAVGAERVVLAAAGGGCASGVAAHATVREDTAHLRVMAAHRAGAVARAGARVPRAELLPAARRLGRYVVARKLHDALHA